MWKLRPGPEPGPRLRLTCPRSHSPCGPATSTGTPRWQPHTLSAGRILQPPARPDPRGSLEQPEQKGPKPGVDAAFPPTPRQRRDPRRCRALAPAAAPAHPTCRRLHSRQPHPLPGSGALTARSAAGSSSCKRREVRPFRGRRGYLRWALSSRLGRPGPPEACRTPGCSRPRARPPLGLFTPLRRRTPRPHHVTCASRVRPRAEVVEVLPGNDGRAKGSERSRGGCGGCDSFCFPGLGEARGSYAVRTRKGRHRSCFPPSLCEPWARPLILLVL